MGWRGARKTGGSGTPPPFGKLRAGSTTDSAGYARCGSPGSGCTPGVTTGRGRSETRPLRKTTPDPLGVGRWARDARGASSPEDGRFAKRPYARWGRGRRDDGRGLSWRVGWHRLWITGTVGLWECGILRSRWTTRRIGGRGFGRRSWIRRCRRWCGNTCGRCRSNAATDRRRRRGDGGRERRGRLLRGVLADFDDAGRGVGSCEWLDNLSRDELYDRAGCAAAELRLIVNEGEQAVGLTSMRLVDTNVLFYAVKRVGGRCREASSRPEPPGGA